MSAFTYRAINDDSKEIRGQIDASDLTSAKQALEALHLDVVEIHEASRSAGAAVDPEPQEQPVLRTTFAFEGTDTAKNIRRGTLQAETKYQAFEKLKHDQKLFVTMLSPLGVTPQYRDNDLENWQRKEIVVEKPTKSIRFTVPDVSKPAPVQSVAPASAPEGHVYHPLVSTLRVYAGWLLAWYGLFVALGYYAHERMLSWNLPFVEAFFLSPLIFSFIVAIFLFLSLGSIHRVICGRWLSRIVLGSLGIGAFALTRLSVF
ncbi:hypothetical protein EXS65_01580 [Candidatus Peribacteria bacterium]|nr:hypothetical protein [Candidatus Peribacteria bacterium]